MHRWQCALLAVVVAAVWAGGCAQRRTCCPTPGCWSHFEAPMELIERSKIVTDTSAVGSLASVNSAIGKSADGTLYYALTAEDCQCRAAEQSSLANLMDGERRVLRSQSRHGISPETAVRLRALSTAAEEDRNHSASQALQLYYSLAEVEARLDLGIHSEQELEGDMRRVKEMRQQGLEVPFDDSEYTRQLAELRSRRIDAEIQRLQSNHDLRRLLGVSAENPDARLWPSTPLTVTVEPIDADEAVSTGLAMRPEIRGLRQLSNAVNEDTLPAINQALRSINGMLGAEAVKCAPHLGAMLAKHKASRTEVPLRRQQLVQYANQREQQLSEQIRSGVAEVNDRLRQIALAKETAANWQHHIAALRAKSTTGQSTFVDIGAARLKSLDADGNVIHAIAAWEIARVKLAELQGRLISECEARAGCQGVCVLPAIRTPASGEPLPLPPGETAEPSEPPPAFSNP
ncbi:MAG TPA: hypothetical protein VHV55_11265 [Pirellulales bacterium]|nr:hypothetical protein [Pirellulales bacterium]